MALALWKPTARLYHEEHGWAGGRIHARGSVRLYLEVDGSRGVGWRVTFRHPDRFVGVLEADGRGWPLGRARRSM